MCDGVNWCELGCCAYESIVLNSSGDSAVVEENISNDGNCTGDDIAGDPSRGEAKTTTCGIEEVLIVNGLNSVELADHWFVPFV